MKPSVIKVAIITTALNLILCIIYNEYIVKCENKEKNNTICVKLTQPEFLMSNDIKKDLPKVLSYYEVKHPDIVYAQAILETGFFRSKICKNYNNLFGLYNSYKHDYYKFEHWTESVLGYINYIQYRYQDDEDYYEFLQRIGYASDPEYINKLKKLTKYYNYEN